MSVCLASSAQTITSSQALEKARKFLGSDRPGKSMAPGTAVSLKQISQQQVLSSTHGDQLYIFNIGDDNGFVIVSGDERTPDILGYADKGSINPFDMPENMRSWLEGYAEEIYNLNPNPNPNLNKLKAPASHKAIPSFLGCEWNQNAPFSLKCPSIDGKIAPTGCAATVLAQVLYYLRPNKVSSIPGYVTESKGISMPALPATTFNWGIMRSTYSSSDTDASAQEVARLLLYCGQALKMDYNKNSSSAVTSHIIKEAKDYFGLSNSASQIYRKDVTSDTWDNIIYEELANYRPVIVSGRNASSGHAFLCDGYDGNGLYHINWGWGGTSNGFFHLNRLNPDSQGIGGSNDGYNEGNYILIGLELDNGQNNVVALSTYDIYGCSTSVTRQTFFSPQISAKFLNQSATVTDYKMCWGIFDENNKLVDKSNEVNVFDLKSGYIRTLEDMTYYFGADLGDGTYYLKALSYQYDGGSHEWKLNPGSQVFYIKMVVKGNTATFQLPKRSGERSDYRISNASLEGNRVANVDQVLSFDVKNAGDTFTGVLQLSIDGKEEKHIAVNIDPGATERVSATFAIPTTGSHTITISNIVGDNYVTLYSTSCTIEQESFCPLSFSLMPVGYVAKEGSVYIVNSPEVNLNCTMTNRETTPYNSSIRFWKYTDSFKLDSEVGVRVPAKGSSTVAACVHGLQENVVYDIYAGYKTATNWSYSSREGIKVKYVPAANAITNVESRSSNAGNGTTLIDGRRVNGNYRGIVIRNGKKYISK